LPKRDAKGIALPPIECTVAPDSLRYRYVDLTWSASERVARLTITAPDTCPTTAEAAVAEGAAWWIFQAFRELEDALLHLRFDLRDLALVLVRAVGNADTVRTTDGLLADKEHWFIEEVRHSVKRTLKKVDLSSKSFYSVIDDGTTFTGTFLELALAGDRTYLLDDPGHTIELGVTVANAGMFPMPNGISRLETRFLGEPERVHQILEQMRQIPAAEANELGLATFAPDEIDWDDELRLAIEERASFSPDALTGMESNLRFAGPETMETKIFGRLSAWQNWIFQRPNAAGDKGALVCYGTPTRPEFATERT
jgi:benzoyl-CoA-dihydrodiol lyase